MLHQKSLFTWLYFFVFIPNVPKIQHTMNQLVNRKCEMMGFTLTQLSILFSKPGLCLVGVRLCVCWSRLTSYLNAQVKEKPQDVDV